MALLRKLGGAAMLLATIATATTAAGEPPGANAPQGPAGAAIMQWYRNDRSLDCRDKAEKPARCDPAVNDAGFLVYYGQATGGGPQADAIVFVVYQFDPTGILSNNAIAWFHKDGANYTLRKKFDPVAAWPNGSGVQFAPGKVTFTLSTYRDTDPRCCPSGRKTFTWQLSTAPVMPATAGPAAAKPTPTVENGQNGIFDKPDKIVPVRLAPATGMITCYYYPTFTVKEMVSGKGADAISVTPFHGQSRPPCGKQDDPGEVVLPGGRGKSYQGAKGGFLYIVATDGNGFAIYSAKHGQASYRDFLVGDSPEALSVENGTLTFRYVRRIDAPCSIISEGQSCWARTISEAHLVAAVASQPAPTALCQAGYAKWFAASKMRMDPADPSVLGYDVTVEIDAAGRSRVTNSGAITVCEPEP